MRLRLPRFLGLGRPRPYRIPDGLRVYAVGDVHGRADLLQPMLGWIRQDSEARAGQVDVHIVFLGDLIDRGPQSAGVIDLLLDYETGFARRHFVRGNHEEVLLDILDGDVAAIGDWLGFGGAATLESYGVDPALYAVDPDAFVAAMHAAIPARHVDFLRAMQDGFTIGDYLFVHAGVRPRRALAAQRPRDLRWIRDDFLNSRADHGFMVVHGHTISPAAQFRRNRIGIDTGAYDTGRLTVLGLEDNARWTLTSRMDLPGG